MIPAHCELPHPATPRCMHLMPRPAGNFTQARIKSHRSLILADFRSRMDAFIWARMTACCTALVWRGDEEEIFMDFGRIPSWQPGRFRSEPRRELAYLWWGRATQR